MSALNFTHFRNYRRDREVGLFETLHWTFVYKDETSSPIIQTVTLSHQHLPLLQLSSADTKPDNDNLGLFL
jgi:hypothetical protein